jgi:hypothetical protein
MCMACNNRQCEVCRCRFGAHRSHDDACPGDEPGTFRETRFVNRPKPPSPSRDGGSTDAA